ncbi:MAG: sensor domain-containing diguanylate cyclase [Desulfosporosinus sp.]|nr:sensor domain-containing diguanylate cyclase [Desulfosporosinus sp.]
MDSLFSQVLDQMNIGTIVVDQNLTIVIWNAWIEQFTHIQKGQAIGQKIETVCPRFGEKIYFEILQKSLFFGQRRFCSGALHSAFIFPANNTLEATIRQNMEIGPIYYDKKVYALIQIIDITSHLNRVHQLKNIIKALEIENEHIKVSERISNHHALHDCLTNLPNRTLLDEQLNLAIKYARRTKELLAVLFLDLDEFKLVNDNFGHSYGDELLRGVSERLQACIRKSDLLSRFGGDEFIIVLSQIKTKQDVKIIAEKVISAFEQPFEIYDQIVFITLSIGISVYPSDTLDAKDLIKNADLAMYRSKKSRKNSFSFFDSGSNPDPQ